MTGATAADALDRAADVIARNGYCWRYLWDTDQAAVGTPRGRCRVDVLGALGIALHGDPQRVLSREVRQLENLLAARLAAPSLASWCSRPGIRQRQALRLLRSTAARLRARAR